jgi:hypothetical protein
VKRRTAHCALDDAQDSTVPPRPQPPQPTTTWPEVFQSIGVCALLCATVAFIVYAIVAL